MQIVSALLGVGHAVTTIKFLRYLFFFHFCLGSRLVGSQPFSLSWVKNKGLAWHDLPWMCMPNYVCTALFVDVYLTQLKKLVDTIITSFFNWVRYTSTNSTDFKFLLLLAHKPQMSHTQEIFYLLNIEFDLLTQLLINGKCSTHQM